MVNIQQLRNELCISYFNAKGGITLERFPIPDSQQYVWVHCPADDPSRNKNYISQMGLPVKRMRSQYLNKYRQKEFLADLPQEARDRIFAPHQPQKWFLDIETEMVGAKPDAENPMGKVYTIAYCHEGDVRFIGIKPLTPTQQENIGRRVNDYLASTGIDFKIKYKFYGSEPQMLADFFYSQLPYLPLVAGWNSLKFDFCYLTNRCEKLGINYKKASPTESNLTLMLSDKFNPTVKHEVKLPMHRAIIDYMQIFEKWDTSIKIKSSMNLDAIAEEVLGLRKVKTNMRLDKLYEEDYETYVFYNIIDTILVMLIDKKSQTFNTMLRLSLEGQVQLIDSLFASQVVESRVVAQYYKRKVVMVKEKKLEGVIKKSYSGGWVKEPGKGKHHEVSIFDYRSMFPSLIAQGNYGLDTLLGYTHDLGKTYVDLKGQTHRIDPEHHTWAASGTVFSKDKDSVLRSVVLEIFDGRVDCKVASGEIEHEISLLEKMLEPVG